MSDQRTPPQDERDDTPPSVEQVARLDAFLDQLGAEQRPAPHQLSAQETAEHMMAAQLRLARDRAISQRAESLLELNLEARTFRVSPDENSHRLPGKIDLKLYTAQRDLLSDKVGAIRFFPDGGSNGGRITLAAGERKYDVDVDWLTGRIAILE